MKFCLVATTNENGAIVDACVVADYAMSHEVERQAAEKADCRVQAVEVREHWSARIVHPTTDAERDCR